MKVPSRRPNVVGAEPAQRAADEEPPSAPSAVPTELRGRRVMTRLLSLSADVYSAGRAPQVVQLDARDELQLRRSALHTFGQPGADAALASDEAWRAFLVRWFERTVSLAVVLDADETSVR